MPKKDEADREARQQARKERLAAIAGEEMKRDFARAGVDYDHRTAVAQRGIELTGGFGKGQVRAVIPHFNNCFKKREDRTQPRQLAWAAFDGLQGLVSQSQVKAQNYEPGVDASTTPGIGEATLDVIAADKALQAFIGARLHRMLRVVIFEGHRYTDVAASTGMHVEAVATVFKIALDEAATFWGYDKRTPIPG